MDTMTEKQRQELRTLAENLHRVPDKKFMMTTWGQGILDTTTEEFTCKYAGCAIGWAPKLIPGCGLELRPSAVDGGLIVPHFEASSHFHAVSAYFGLTSDE